MKRHNTGEEVFMGVYHYCPLVDDNSEVYPDDMDCVDEEAYKKLLDHKNV